MSSVRLSMELSPVTVSDCFSVMKDSKQKSSKVLMMLLFVMYINQSVLAALNWYLAWLAYVKYSASNDQALAVYLPSEETPLRVLNITATINFLAIFRLGVADSIMVFRTTHCLFCSSHQIFRSGAVGSSAIVVGKQQACHLP
jgi:hypothetical protein